MKIFSALTKFRNVQNHGVYHRLLAPKRPIFDPCQFPRNRHKQWRKELERPSKGLRRRFRDFGVIYSTYQNPPCSKPCAIAQTFSSKTDNFRPLRIHPKSTQTVAQAVTNLFITVLQMFQRVWSDLMLCDASGAEFGLMQRRWPGVELAQNAWTVAK